MERRANYALVGVVSLGLFVGLMAFVVWLAGFQFNKQYDLYNVLFIGPVRGISEGGEVHFNGIKVGEVSKLFLDSTDPNHVIATVRLTAGVPVRVDSYAILEPQGITGVNYVQITGGSPDKPLLKAVTPRGTIPVIHSQRSALSDLLAGGGDVLQRAVQALDRVNKLLSDENIASVSGTLKDMKAVGDELAERKAIIGDAQKALQDIDLAAQGLNELSHSTNELMKGDGKRAVGNIADTAGELKLTARQLRGMLTRLDGPASDFAQSGLPKITDAVSDLQRASRSLDLLAKELQSSPQGALSRPPAKEVQVKP